MKLIVGLGNPGPKYALTRHNIGFLAVDAFNEIHGAGGNWKSEHKAETAKIRHASDQILLVKPQTFMNLSGQSVVSLMQFYQIERQDILIVQDDVDQKFGAIKFQIKRGHGGHNGIRNIHELLGSDEYARLKLGVGRPPVFVSDDGEVTRSTMEVADWVLQNFSKEEQKVLPDFIEKACQAIEGFATVGLERASNQFNQKG
jgi:peptidyl-tRNA hydrolase, PTH1 family